MIFLISREEVEEVLDEVRPALQADGGDVELLEVEEDGTVTVQLSGACQGCPMSAMTLKGTIERVLQDRLPEVKEVQT